VRGVGKSEWLGSDDGQDNITCHERGAILRPGLDCSLSCETVKRIAYKDKERVYGVPGKQNPTVVVGERCGQQAKNRTVSNCAQ
jgi:hypothetical protein